MGEALIGEIGEEDDPMRRPTLNLAFATAICACLTACRKEPTFSPKAFLGEARSHFASKEQDLSELVAAVQQDGLEHIAYIRPGTVLVGEQRKRLAGKEREKYITLFENAKTSRVVKVEGCYEIGATEIPDPEKEVLVALRAPCEAANTEPDCRSLPSPIPARGVCETPLDAGWYVRCVWFTVPNE